MSSFEDIETQNGRRLAIYGKSKAAGFYADANSLRVADLIEGAPPWLCATVRGSMLEHATGDWLHVMADAFGVSGRIQRVAVRAPRRPRTALGFGLLGPVETFIAAGLVRLRYALDPRSTV